MGYEYVTCDYIDGEGNMWHRTNTKEEIAIDRQLKLLKEKKDAIITKMCEIESKWGKIDDDSGFLGHEKILSLPLGEEWLKLDKKSDLVDNEIDKLEYGKHSVRSIEDEFLKELINPPKNLKKGQKVGHWTFLFNEGKNKGQIIIRPVKKEKK